MAVRIAHVSLLLVAAAAGLGRLSVALEGRGRARRALGVALLLVYACVCARLTLVGRRVGAGPQVNLQPLCAHLVERERVLSHDPCRRGHVALADVQRRRDLGLAHPSLRHREEDLLVLAHGHQPLPLSRHPGLGARQRMLGLGRLDTNDTYKRYQRG